MSFAKASKKNTNVRTSSNERRRKNQLLKKSSYEEKTDPTHNQPTTTSLSSNKKKHQRRYYLPKETLHKLKNDKQLVQCIKQEFNEIRADFLIDYNSGQAVIAMRKMDNERTLNILQDNVGIAITEAEFQRLAEELISIERNREELMSDPSQTLTNVLQAISQGISFLKHAQFGSVKRQWFSFDHDRLYWKDKQDSDNQLNRSMEMKSIVRVRPGKTTKLLKSGKCKKVNANHCMSIIGVRKVLDLECKSRTERDEWFTYIEFAHRHWVRAKRKTMRIENEKITLDELILDVD